MSITTQFSRPINAKLSIPGQEPIYGRFECFDGNSYFWTPDKVFVGEYTSKELKQVHPFNPAVVVTADMFSWVPRDETPQFQTLPSGNNQPSSSAA